MSKGPSHLSDRRKTFYVSAALTLITVLLYWRTVAYEFIVVDDHQYVYQNSNVLKGLTWDGIKWAFTTTRASNWHPLTWLSHMLDVSLYGLFAGGHHLTSAAIHLANILLLFLVLKQLTGKLWPSAFVAALFGWHPMHVESVAWICERKDVLSMFFLTLTLGAYGRYAAKPTTAKYLTTLLLFALGLMSKPMLVTLPFVLLLLDYWPLARFTNSKPEIRNPKSETRNFLFLAFEKIPFFILSLLSCVVTVYAQHKGGAVQTLEHVPLSSRLVDAINAYGAYLGKAVWPIHLSVFYPLPAVTSWSLFTASLIALVVLTGIAIRERRRAPWLIVGWLWFLGTLVPVIGLVQVGNQFIADRYTYIPYIGLFIMLAWSLDAWLKWSHAASTESWIKSSNMGASEMVTKSHPLPAGLEPLGKWRKESAEGGGPRGPSEREANESLGWGEGERRSNLNIDGLKLPLIVGASLVLLACVLLTSIQLSYWRNSITLFTHAIAVTKSNVFCERNLSYALSEAGRGKEAIPHYEALLALTPNDVKARYNLGLELLNAQRPADAEQQFSEALKYQPNSDKLHNNLGIALSQQGQLDAAATEFQKAIQLNPQFPWPCLNYAIVLQKKGLAAAAVTNYTKALALQPDWPEALDKLAYLLATCPDAPPRNPAQAIRLATQATNLTERKSPDLLHTLALAYAAAGEFTNATTTAELAQKEARTAKLDPLASKLQTEIENYRAEKIPNLDWQTPPDSTILRK